jgi:hypothetical protein
MGYEFGCGMTSFLWSRFDGDTTSGLLHRRLDSALGFLLLIVSVEDSPSGTGYRTGEYALQWGCLRTSLRGGAVFTVIRDAW